MNKFKIEIPMKEVEAFCKKWKVAEFALFGSVLREDFDIQKSDIDILILFDEKVHTSLFDFVEMKEELENLFKRQVDLVSKRGIEKSTNPIRKEAILNNYEVVYAQAA